MDEIYTKDESQSQNEIYTKIVGVSFENENGSHRQEALAQLEFETLPLKLHLKREPENPHDPYAVAVLCPKGRQLGYINRGLSFSISTMIDYGYHLSTELLTLTGTQELTHHYGANIRIQFEEPSFQIDF